MSFFANLFHAIEREYERRIRAASQITEYGAGHGHGHTNDPHTSHAGTHDEVAIHEDDNDAAEIVNLPRGVRVPRSHE